MFCKIATSAEVAAMTNEQVVLKRGSSPPLHLEVTLARASGLGILSSGLLDRFLASLAFESVTFKNKWIGDPE